MGNRRPLVTDLPGIVPVFPLSGALLLPGGRLPLTVFEPRYLAMTDDALAAGRLMGMIQPCETACGPVAGLFSTGCLGRITSFAESGDGRYLVTLLGVCRFRLTGEDDGKSGYRRVRVDYRPYGDDLDEGPASAPIERARLLAAVKAMFGGHGIAVNWSALEGADDHMLVTTLAMTCPLSPEEKQALLEAPTLAERCDMMTAMIEMALLAERNGGGSAPIH
ncbi:MAG: LON peptidase substrate-binding domain-containing protein [Actinomycetota bacterium]